MPKTPTTPRSLRSPGPLSPYARTTNDKNNANLDDSFAAPSLQLKAEARAAIPPPILLAKPISTTTKLAVASTNPAENAFYSMSGDFLRSGVYTFSKSGKHPVENPLDNKEKGEKKAKWLMVQFNVVVKEESSWTCEVQMKRHGGLLVGKDVLNAVQSGGEGASKRAGKFVLTLKPPYSENMDGDTGDDPRIAISYFFEFTEKLYMQALDGTMPYSFLLTRNVHKEKKREKLRKIFR